MDNATTIKTVRAVIVSVLEDAAFIFTNEINPESKPDPSAWKADGVSLSFSGEKQGTLRLWASCSFAPLLAANMLGNDTADDLPRQKVLDALKETANIIIGNSLTALFGETAVFDLGIPEAADPGLLAADCARQDGIWLAAEEGELLCVTEILDP